MPLFLSLKYIKQRLLLSVCALASFSSEAQTTGSSKGNAPVLQVKGRVTEASTGKPLRAINVTYQDYSAAITDSTGYFTLKVPNYNVSIVLVGEGVQSKEVALKGRATISAALYEDTYTSFYDAANTPFGERSNNQLPFSVTSIQTSGNWRRTAETPDAFLQGQVAGLNAIRRSGTPNIGASLFLRGISSLYTYNQPLVVVDGVIFDNKDYGSILSNNYTNPLAYIDIKDIDNITVIKDGSSTYGTKGANGVINITTARAKELATRIDFAVYGGVNYSPKNLPVLGASDYRSYLVDLLQSAGITESQMRKYSYLNDDPSNPNYYRYHGETDWQKQVFNNSSLNNYYLKVTGGDNIAKYALSMGFLSNAAVIRNTDMNRYNALFNADLNLSKRLTANANLSFTYNAQTLKDQGLSYKTNPIYVALIKSPFIGVNEVTAKGLTSPDITDTDTFNVSNPAALIGNMEGLNRNYRFLGSINFNYLFSKSISLSTLTSITVDKIRESIFVPRRGVVNDTLSDGTIGDSRLSSQTKRILNFYNDTRLSYDKVFGQIHHFTARAGLRFMQTNAEQDKIFGANSATDQLTSIGNGVANANRTGGDITEFKWLNTYLNADYSLSDKYFFSFNVAMDGSSRFGKNVTSGGVSINGNSYAVLPSIAGAWLISSEKFMADARFIDLLKLRASFGLSGNDDVGDYNEQQYFVPQNFLGTQGLVVRNFGNDQLQWESMHKLNVGVDASLFNERLNLTFDAYQNKTNKMLAYASVPVASGLRYALTNSGEMQTTGVEASIRSRVINRASLKWDIGLTVAHYKSLLNKLPSNEFMTPYAGGTILSRVGYGPNVFYGHQTNGVYSTDAEAAAAGLTIMQPNGTILSFKGGDMRFNDINGDKIIDDQDRQIIGNPNPDFYGSINTHIDWKRFSLDGLFTFSQGNDIYNYTRRQLESEASYNNQTSAILNRWQNNGQVTDIPKASFGDPMGNSRFSDRWIEDGSYLRLRTASLSYNLPIKAGFLRYSVVYVTGNNLFTLQKYLGYDPEMSATSNVLGQGVDVTLEPQYRSVQVGIRVGL